MDLDSITKEELISYTINMMRKYGIRPKRRLGQHFVIEPRLIKEMLMAAEISKNDIVLEVGAGIGTLTQALAEKCKRVIAVEVDRKLIGALNEVAMKEGNVDVVHADILKYKPPSEVNKVISNIPYNISSPFTEMLLKRLNFEVAVITYQLEFARRLYASPGDDNYSRLTILAYYYAEIRPIKVIPPACFFPRPDIFSELVLIKPKEEKPFILSNEEFFFTFVRELFSQRRRVLRHALQHVFKNLNIDTSILPSLERDLSSILRERVEKLDPETLAKISNIIWHRIER